jgi:hypothetical protein
VPALRTPEEIRSDANAYVFDLEALQRVGAADLL